MTINIPDWFLVVLVAALVVLQIRIVRMTRKIVRDMEAAEERRKEYDALCQKSGKVVWK